MFTHNIFSYQILQYLFADCRVIELFLWLWSGTGNMLPQDRKKNKTYFPNLNLSMASSA